MRRLLFVGALCLALAGTSAAATQTIDMQLHDWLHIAPDTIVADLGDVLEMTVTNPDINRGPHDVRFDDFDAATPKLLPNQTVPLSVLLDKAGTFTYYCSVPGHADGGMVGTLKVRDPSAPAEEDATPGPAWVGALLVLALVALGGRRR